MNKTIQCLSVIGGLILLAACSDNREPQPAPEKSDYHYKIPEIKNDGWEVATLNELNIEEAKLTQMMNAIGDGEYKKIDSVVIIRSNKMVFDELIRTRLDNVDPVVGNRNLAVHSVQSVSKSVVSALVGIAIDQGAITSVNDKIWNYLPNYINADNWDYHKSQISIHDLLTMQHGLEWDEWSYPYSDDRNSLGKIYRNCDDWIRCTLDLPMSVQSGTKFTYSTAISIVLGVIVENAVSMPLEEFAQDFLFEPIGIESALWDFTPQGYANTGGGLFLSSRDMAKIGQLYHDNGFWQTNPIVSNNWVELSTQALIDISDIASFRQGYGYQWWQRSFDFVDHNSNPQSINLFHAEGNGGQFIYVIPSLDAVVIFTAGNYDKQSMRQPEDLLTGFILPAFFN